MAVPGGQGGRGGLSSGLNLATHELENGFGNNSDPGPGCWEASCWGVERRHETCLT